MNPENLKLFGAFLLINSLMVVMFGFTHESITFYSELPQAGYQVISTHFSHHSWPHFLGNMAGLLVLLVLFPEKNQILFLSFLLCILFVAWYALWTNINSFLGASALLYCVPGSHFANDLKHNKKQALMILFILCLYLFIISPMKTNDPENTWAPMTAAHILGFVAGIVANYCNKLTLNKHYKA